MAKILPLFKTEYKLAKAISQGDSKAQKQFYEKYSGQFLGICCRYIKDQMAAEDIMVESMMRIFDKSKQFNYKGSFEGWCKRVVVNQALNYLRSEKIQEDLSDIDIPVFADTTDQLEAEDLLSLIRSLPSGYRMVFNLYAIEGYSHAEIAEMLNISEGTSKSQLSRARAFLQERLKKNELSTAVNS